MGDAVNIRFDVVDLARRRLQQDKNNLVVFTGETGSGKSMAGLDYARKLDPLFTVDNVVFTVQDFIRKMQDVIEADEQHRTICRTLVFDEVAVDFDSRRSSSRKNVDFSNILKVFRYLQINVVFTLPNLEMFDVNGRRLIHFHAVMAGIDRHLNRAATHFFIVDAHKSWGGEPKRFFPVLHIRNLNQVVQIDPVWFNLPPKDLIRDYQQKKGVFVKRMFDQMEKQWAEKPEKEPEMPIPDGAPIFQPPDPSPKKEKDNTDRWGFFGSR